MSEILQRKASLKSSNDETKTLDFVIVSSDNACTRFDWASGRYYTETLDVKGAQFGELKTMFKDHNPSVDNAIARVENVREENGELVCECVFASDEDSQKIYRKYADGVLSDVSIGYSVKDFKKTKGDKIDDVLVTKFNILELSAVWKGADKGAKKREDERVAEISAYQKAKLRSLNLKLKELQL